MPEPTKVPERSEGNERGSHQWCEPKFPAEGPTLAWLAAAGSGARRLGIYDKSLFMTSAGTRAIFFAE